MNQFKNIFFVLFLVIFFQYSLAAHEDNGIFCDVVVVGGGFAGVSAAVQAARSDAKTILIEDRAYLGNNSSHNGFYIPNLFSINEKPIIAGIGKEWIQKTIDLDREKSLVFDKKNNEIQLIRINPLLLAAIAEEMCIQAGVELRFFEVPYQIVALKTLQKGLGDPKANESEMNWRLLTASCGENRKIFCRELIDCTKNGVVCRLIGAKLNHAKVPSTSNFNYTIKTNLDLSTIDRKTLEKKFREAVNRGDLKETDVRGGIMSWLKNASNNNIYATEYSTAASRTAANSKGRMMMLRMLRFVRSLPGGENAYLTSMATETNTKKSCSIQSECPITVEDYCSGKIWNDSLAYSFYSSTIRVNNEVLSLKKDGVPTVPLKSMIPKEIDHLLVAGPAFDCDWSLNYVLQTPLSTTARGQSAGAAAAQAVKEKKTPAKINIEEVKKTLKKNGAIVP